LDQKNNTQTLTKTTNTFIYLIHTFTYFILPKIREKIWGRDLLTAEGREEEGKKEKEGWIDDRER